MKGCSVEGCKNPSRTRGWCHAHYSRWLRHGDVLYQPKVSPSMGREERLRFHGWTETEAGCWEFDGWRDPDGYGRVWVDSRSTLAHRLAHEVWVGSIPEGMSVMHSCDNPPCINPAHLSVGTSADNSADKVAKGRQSRAGGRPRKQVAHG